MLLNINGIGTEHYLKALLINEPQHSLKALPQSPAWNKVQDLTDGTGIKSPARLGKKHCELLFIHFVIPRKYRDQTISRDILKSDYLISVNQTI